MEFYFLAVFFSEIHCNYMYCMKAGSGRGLAGKGRGERRGRVVGVPLHDCIPYQNLVYNSGTTVKVPLEYYKDLLSFKCPRFHVSLKDRLLVKCPDYYLYWNEIISFKCSNSYIYLKNSLSFKYPNSHEYLKNILSFKCPDSHACFKNILLLKCSN